MGVADGLGQEVEVMKQLTELLTLTLPSRSEGARWWVGRRNCRHVALAFICEVEAPCDPRYSIQQYPRAGCG
jgi:hypothetical protein